MLCRFRMVVIALVVVVVSTTLVATPVSAQTVYICAGEQATIVGTDGDDVLRGTTGPDVIVALGGDDIVAGLAGDDVICGGHGNDQIFGGQGLDVLYGSNGNDTIFAAYGSTLDDRQDTNRAHIYGGRGNDVLYGSNRWDRIDGGPGADRIEGFEGRDRLRGGPGADRITGGPNPDDLRGGNGRDTIFVTDGDTARGGMGRDRCNILEGEPDLVASCGTDEREPAEPINAGPPKEPEAAPAPEADPEIELEPVADPLPLAPPPPPAPVSILQSGFVLDGDNGTEWEGRIYGVIPVDQAAFSARRGRCFLILGELTPTAIPTGLVSRGFEAPTLGAIAGSDSITSGSRCDTSEAIELGYEDVFDAEATLGTTVPVYRQIYVPAANESPISSLFVRGPLATSSIVEPAETLQEIPAPGDLAVGAPAQGLTIGLDTVTFSTFEGAEWDVDLTQVLESTLDPRIDRSGRCFLVLGTLTPTVVNGRVNSGFETPRITGIVDGRHVDEVTLCDTALVESAGFEAILSAEVRLGQSFNFFSTIFVDETRTGPLSHVIVGRANLDGHLFNVQAPTPV